MKGPLCLETSSAIQILFAEIKMEMTHCCEKETSKMNILAMPQRSLRNGKYATCLKRSHVTKGLIRKHFIAIAPRHTDCSLIIGGL